jgi:hypothetical protein
MPGRAFILAISVTLSLAVSGASSQQVLNVPSQYKTIQAAIDAAQASDTVLVAPGTYQENIDFKGKAIRVQSTHGPEVTLIEGQVSFHRGERADSVIEGFTIRLGNPGIVIQGAGPTIRGNIIRDNTIIPGTWSVSGAGIRATCLPDRPAIIVNNRIEGNRIEVSPGLFFGGTFGGAGMSCRNVVVMGNQFRHNVIGGAQYSFANLSLQGGALEAQASIVANNVISSNVVSFYTSQGGTPIRGYGGGIWAVDCKIINNTVTGNGAVNTNPFPTGFTFGGGIHADVACVIANNIIRDNFAYYEPEISTGATVQYCNVKGGRAGPGNFDADPRFTSDGTFHLAPDSPCRDTGSQNYLNFSASDFEWDDRGWGSGVDIGADEFAPHVYHHGETRAGKTFTLTVIGAPGRVAWLGYAASLLQQPIPIPGSGQLWLDPWTLQLMPLGMLPATGQFELKLSIPSNAPLVSVPFQALVGIELTRPEVVQVAP